MTDRLDERIKLSVVTPGGPILAYHVGWIASGALYVHGGIKQPGCKTPLSNLHRYDFDSGTWHQVHATGSPALSHHACVLIDCRYAVLIGGWNGRRRTADVHVYDVLKSRWSSPVTLGFPTGAGLSSHSAALLPGGDVIVVGREGAVRMQSRYGSAFVLRGDPATSDTPFRYSEHAVFVTSRSGHSIHVTNRSVVIVGGRDDQVVEAHSCEPESSTSSACSTMSRLAHQLTMYPSPSAVEKPMTGRRHHVAVSGSGVIFVHGGWTFDGRSRDPVGHMFVLLMESPYRWVYLGDSGIVRAGHVCCANENCIYVHGGEGAKGIVHGSLYQLNVPHTI
jgi:Galactose oxidase, central domain